MGHPIRMYENLGVYFITNRLAFSTPFIPCKFMNEIIKGVFAKAQERSPAIHISNLTVMPNHYHVIVTIDGEPSQLKDFLNLVNGELGKIVCKLLGKKNVKVWSQRTSVIALITPDKVIEKIAYCCLNPVKANFTETADNWSGINSYYELLLCSSSKSKFEKDSKYVPPSKIPYLQDKPQSIKELGELSIYVAKVEGESHKLVIEPLYWTKAFKKTANSTKESISVKIVDLITKRELELSSNRNDKKQKVVGKHRLLIQNPHKTIKLKKPGRRIIVIASCPELRVEYIKRYKEFCFQCRRVWKLWLKLEYWVSYPPGAFRPPGYPNANRTIH